MTNLYIAEVGELFQNEDSFFFLSDQNLYEYDFIIIDTQTLINEINGHSEKAVQKRVEDLKNFISKKNIPVVFLISESGGFTLDGKEFTIFSILNLEVKEIAIKGKKIEKFSDGLFGSFLKQNQDIFEYVAAFAEHPGISIGTAKSQALSIGFYTKDFVFLPTFNEDNYIEDDVFLEEIHRLARSVRQNDATIILPDWTNDFHLPKEKQKLKELSEIEKDIAKMEKRKQGISAKLQQIISIKQLWTASGFVLETVVRQVFNELGFVMLDTEAGRDDIIMKWKDKIIVCEIKGVTKSAGEKNAAQLEKWVSSYYADKGIKPKGLLIVNTFRETSLEKRTEISFPEQMIPYVKQRNHCLITTLQLCGMLIYFREKPDEHEDIINQLLSTDGRFAGFSNWFDFIEKT